MTHVDSVYLFPAVVARRTHISGWPALVRRAATDGFRCICITEGTPVSFLFSLLLRCPRALNPEPGTFQYLARPSFAHP